MGLLLRAGQLLLSAAVVGAAVPSCYSAGAGTAPPPNSFYFPVGLAVSKGAKVLYAVNSDFDLQWNGGTLQTYDLSKLRRHAAKLIRANLGTPLPADPGDPLPFAAPAPGCPGQPIGGKPLGQVCAPPVDSKNYFHASATIGAFATGLQISIAVAPVTPDAPDGRRRLFIPVRGDAALTWADVEPDPSFSDPHAPIAINCGQGADNRCDASHHAGSDPDQCGNTRHATMPGEPFGMAQTEDGSAIAITHQADTKTSLLLTGLSPVNSGSVAAGVARNCSGASLCCPDGALSPSMQFVLDGLPFGGIGIAAVPHDPAGPVSRCEDVANVAPCVRPAFLETNRNTAEIDLLRYYDDDGTSYGGGGTAAPGSSLHRPFLQREAAYPITSNAVGIDSRGLVIDKTRRIACEKGKKCGLPGADRSACSACAQLPARVFFASRTPPALGIGEIGGPPPSGAGTYDPDQLVLTGNVPLPVGPSSVYLAPVVEPTGNLALRVFVVCFESGQIVVYDPDAEAKENVINVGPGPFAMAFDPFDIQEVGERNSAGDPDPFGNRSYRFAYVASFTQSYVQLIDLDNAQLTDNPQLTSDTFERVVFTLGQPTVPKGQ
jgi:hypothetical protein